MVSDFPTAQQMLLDIVTSIRLFKVQVQQPEDHEIIFSQKDVITLTAELTAHSSVLRISQRHYKAITRPGDIYSKWSAKAHNMTPHNWKTEIVPSHCFSSFTRPTLAVMSLLALEQHLMHLWELLRC